jgi:phosphopantetheinyl transferase
MDDRNGFRQEARLNEGEVQVWRVDAAALAHECWWELLPDEVVRARGIRAKLAREEFVAGRGVLRRLLGRELGCEAREVRISHGAHGKPEVEGIHFNVAHSRGVVLVAISRAGAVGIDVEHGDREVEALEIARGAFHPEEIVGHPEEIAWIERVVATLALGRPNARVTVCEYGGSTDANQEFCLSALLQEESSYVG